MTLPFRQRCAMSFTNKTMTATTTVKNVVLHGYLKKLKTMKKKYFVLYSDGEKSARLEYYDTEKKFRARHGNLKRTIVLKSCFHISKRLDTKHKFVISLYTKDDCFCIVFDTEAELNLWLQSLLSLHRVEDTEGDKPRTHIEHVWQVQVQRRGIAEERGIIGNYHLCLSDKSLTLVRTGQPRTITGENRVPNVEFLLTTIRRCGDSQCYFYMEVGRHSVIGPGELWMGTEDPLISQNMHTTIIGAMSAVTKRDDFNPITRNRSSSANEASRPSQMLQRRQTHVGGAKLFNVSTSGDENSIESTTSTIKADLESPISIRYLDQSSTLSLHQAATSVQTSTKNTTIKNSINACEDDYVCHDGPILAAAPSVSHHRAFSLPIATTTQISSSSNCLPAVPNNPNNNNVSKGTVGPTATNLISTTCFTIQPIHQRTRSLPLTEETAIQLNSLNSNPSPRSSRDSIYSKHNKSSNDHHHHHHHNHHQNNNHIKNIKSNSSMSISTNPNTSLNDVPVDNYRVTCTCTIENDENHQNIPTVMTTTVENSLKNDDVNNIHSVTFYNNIDAYGGSHNDKSPAFKNVFNNKMFMGGGFIQSSYVGGLSLALQRGRSGNQCVRSIGRERCDSLPTRNRTISDTIHANHQNTSMPPPRSIPLANRPHSMYTNRHSHSPPMLSGTPLSPSAGCSESDGSSLSIDETDGLSNPITPDEGGNWKFYNQRSVIPEENPDDFFYGDNNKRTSPDVTKRNGSLSLPISQIMRKGSLAPPSNYDVYSPCGSSPDHQGYLVMSPGVDLGRSFYTNSSGAHSRASSLAEDTENGCYVDTDQVENYVDMEQSPRPADGMSSAASSCSITSGTPSTDLRFAEYQLEKVVSRFTPDEENTSLLSERPLRAYSVGSRLEHNKRKLRVDLLASEHSARARAFSVGSKAKVARSDLYRGTPQTAPLSSITQQHHDAANLTNNNVYKSSNKSSSAPILINKGPPSMPMDDLMEIDFAPTTTPPQTQSLLSTQKPQMSATKKMSLPMLVPTVKKYDGLDLLPLSKPSGYVEMKPAINEYEPMFPGARQDYSYLDMKPVGSGSNKNSFKNLLSMSTSPIKSPKTIGSLNRNNNYMDMSSSQNRNPVAQSPRSSMDDYLNMSPTTHTMNHQRNAMDIDLPKTLSATEGYMEMFWNKPNAAGGMNNNINNNNISDKPVSDEYIYMNAGRPLYNAAALNTEPRLSSLPIDIQLRKKTNIPLTSTATRCDSKDSGIVTPSGSHPAMFPFSPSSQASIDENNLPRKCLVDGTTGTLRLSEEEEEPPATTTTTTMSFTKNLKVLPTVVPMDTSTCQLRPQVDVLSNEYADMTLGAGGGSSSSSRITMTSTNHANQSKHNSDFSNMRVEKRLLSRATSVVDSMPDGDYAIMNPTALPRKLSAPVQQSLAATSVPANKSVPVTIGTNVDASKGFKPIPSSTDEMLLRNVISPTDPVISRHSAFSRQLSERPASSQNYEMLHIRSDTNISYQAGRVAIATTRPNSVNSEKISKTTTASLTRPNSVNCDRLPTTSTSSSTSTLCGSSSSSSTLCGSKCQSPSQTVRPQSFSETDSNSTSSNCAIITSRPPSVSSERGLHYASLDLPPATITSDKPLTKLKVDIGVATNATDLQQSSKSSSGDSSTSPSPNANNVHVEQPSFTYAQIDFAKSSELNTQNSQ